MNSLVDFQHEVATVSQAGTFLTARSSSGNPITVHGGPPARHAVDEPRAGPLILIGRPRHFTGVKHGAPGVAA